MTIGQFVGHRILSSDPNPQDGKTTAKEWWDDKGYSWSCLPFLAFGDIVEILPNGDVVILISSLFAGAKGLHTIPADRIVEM